MSKILNIFSDKMKQLPDYEKEEDNVYIFSDELEDAIRVAVFLGKPLLVTGEPGTGKTKLAYAVVNKIIEAEKKANKKITEDELTTINVFNTKTTSTAKDLLYTYDHLSHFQHIHKKINANEINDIDSKFIETELIKLNALGEAILSGKRDVVLIDEIDKAPRDFPNDILDVIENMEFEIPELKLGKLHPETKILKQGDPAKRPILILTSNSEKSLPEAFLRRCVFFHIKLPDETKLKQILEAKFKHMKDSHIAKHWDLVVKFFLEKREILSRKKPATSELIHWVCVLNDLKFNCEKLKLLIKNNEKLLIEKEEELKLTDEEKRHLILSFSVLAKNIEDLQKLEQSINANR